MTTTLLAPPSSLCYRASVPTWILEIEGMPKGVRMSVEKLMLLLPEAEVNGDVWFTRWHRQTDGTYSCRERIRAPHEAVVEFEHAIVDFASEHGFVARLSRRPYAGEYV